MKNVLGYVAVIVIAVVVSLACCCGLCCKKSSNVAVVDVQRLVNQARQVAELRQDMQTQMSNLQEWVNQSNAEINNEQSQEKKDELTKLRQEELLQRQQLIQRDYAAKLQNLDAKLTAVIEKTAAEEGFKITFVKGSVAAGGTDITDKVIAKLAE